jgi:hypothetical protein
MRENFLESVCLLAFLAVLFVRFVAVKNSILSLLFPGSLLRLGVRRCGCC